MPRTTIVAEHGDHEDVLTVESTETSSLSRILGWVSDSILFALIILLPLFYVPSLSDSLELPKQMLLLSLTTIAGVVWLLRVFVSRTVMVRKSFLFFPILLFLVVMGIATLTSIDRYTSLFGGSLGEYTSFATLAGFFLFLFFSATSSRDLRFVRGALLSLFVVSSIVGFMGILKWAGVSLPGFPKAAFWNPVGSSFVLGIFEAVMLVLASGTLLFESTTHKAWFSGRLASALRVFSIIAGVIAIIALVMLDWWLAWVVTIVGTGLLLLFVFVYAHTFRNLVRLLLPLVSFVLAILFLFVKTPLHINAPIEISPNAKISWQVARSVLQEHPAFGSGPVTYVLDYAKNRPSAFVNTVLWNVRFDRAGSYVLTLLPTIGLVGIIGWLLLMLIMVGVVVHRFLRERDPTAWLLSVVLFLPWLGLAVSEFFYNSNMSLQFLFWCLTALLVISTGRTAAQFTFSRSPRALIGTSLGAVVFAMLMVILLLLGASRASAWGAFANATRANATGDFAKTRETLMSAAQRDPRTDVFVRNLAQVRLLEASQSKDTQALQNTLSAALVSARQATALGPNNSTNWSMLGSISREMTAFVTGAGELGIDAFDHARKLEPQSPVYPTEQGRIEILLADRARTGASSKDDAVKNQAVATMSEHLSNAERLFGEAIQLKSDYGPAHFYTAFVLQRQGKLPDAIKKMESVAKANPRDIGVVFQLGILYVDNKQLDKAEGAFKYALQLSSNYANAHWYLASIYESQGKLDLAIKEIEAVATTNPNNKAVLDRLFALKQGKASTQLPPPVTDEGTSELQKKP